MENLEKPKSKFKTWHKVVLGVVVLFILIGIFSKKDDAAKAEAPTATTSAAASSEEKPLTVTAKQYNSDYQKNEVSADNQYKGKTILITGIIESINKDFSDGIYLSLVAESSDGIVISTVKCNIDKDYEAAAAKLNKGDKITLQGEGSGMIVTIPIIDNCSIK